MAQNVVQTDYFYKLNLGVEHLAHLLFSILHNPNDGLPKNGQLLYQLMLLFIQHIPRNARRFFGRDQKELLCPNDGSQTSDSTKWDVTLISAVIRNWPYNVPPLQNYLHLTQQQLQVICDICVARNKVKHIRLRDLQTQAQFQPLWNEIRGILVNGNYHNLADFDSLGSQTFLNASEIIKVLEAAKEPLKIDLRDLQIDMVNFQIDMVNFQQRNDDVEERVSNVEQIVGSVGEGLSNVEVNISKVCEEVSGVKRNACDMEKRQGELEKRQKITEDIVDGRQKREEMSFNGLQMSVEEFKTIVHKRYLESPNFKPLLGPRGNLESYNKSFQEIFVDLAIIKDRDVDEKAYRFDREYHEKLLECEKEFIKVEDFPSINDQIIFIQGVAGIGKSMLVKKIVSEWHEGRLFNGENGNTRVDLLLPILCRTLNRIDMKPDEGIDNLLRRLFRDIPDLETLLKHFNVAIVIDGIDELRDIRYIEDTNNTSPMLKSIRNLLDPDLMPKIKLIVVGRPHVINLLHSLCNKTFHSKPKAIEIIGFNADNVKHYVYKQFENNTETANDVLQKIQDFQVTKNLCTIPLYLEIIVTIFKDNPFTEMPSRATELLLYNILIYLRNQKDRGLTLGQFAKENNETLKSYIKSISKFAFETLRNNEIIFEANKTRDENSRILKELENVGLLLKVTKGESGVTAYQFLHLTFQELLASFHVLWHPSLSPLDLDDPILRETIVIATGIQGISCGNYGDSILTSFLNNITSTNESTDSRKDAFSDVMRMIKNNCIPSVYDWMGDELIVDAAFENQTPTGFFSDFLCLGRKKIDGMLQIIEQKAVFLKIDFFYKHDRVKSKMYNFIQLLLTDVKTLTFRNVKLNLPWDLKYFKQDSLCEYMNRAVDLVLTFDNYDSKIKDFFHQFTDGAKFSKSFLEMLEIKMKSESASTLLSTIFPFLINSKCIRQLHITGCWMTDGIFSVLLDSLVHVEEVVVSGNNLTQLSVFRLLKHLTPSSSLKTINFSYNKFVNEHFEEIDQSNTNLALQVPVPFNLQKINLAHCSITDEILSVLLNSLVYVEEIDVQMNELTQLSVFRLLKHQTPSSSLKTIDFTSNDFVNEHFEEIDQSNTNHALQVPVPFNLQKINLAHCSITDEILSVLLDSLVHVEKVDVRSNELSPLSVFRLLKHLRPSSLLKTINFNCNVFVNEHFDEINPSEINYNVAIDVLALLGYGESLSQILPIVVRMAKKIVIDYGYEHLLRMQLEEFKEKGISFELNIDEY